MGSSDEVAVISAVRSPFGKFGGTLKDFTLPELGGRVVAEAIRRAGVDPADVEEVATGVNLPGADRSIARQVLIEAGIPTNRVAYTVDRACCSSMAAISMASRSIRLGDTKVAVAGGTENMSRVPYFLTAQRWGHALGDVVLKDQLVIADPMTGKPRAVQVGEEATEYGVTRAEQDAWAVRSHENYLRGARRRQVRRGDHDDPGSAGQGRAALLHGGRVGAPRDDDREACRVADDLRQRHGDGG